MPLEIKKEKCSSLWKHIVMTTEDRDPPLLANNESSSKCILKSKMEERNIGNKLATSICYFGLLFFFFCRK